MSLIAYLTAGKYHGSAWLRDRLKVDALRAQMAPLELGIKTEYTGQGGKFVAEDQMGSGSAVSLPGGESPTLGVGALGLPVVGVGLVEAVFAVLLFLLFEALLLFFSFFLAVGH